MSYSFELGILFLGINEVIHVKYLEQCQTHSKYLINLIIISTCLSYLLLYNKVPQNLVA